MFMILLIFAGYKMNVLFERREYSVLQELFEYHYDPYEFRFGTEKGFAVAAGLTAFDGSEEPIEDETFGLV